MFVDLISRIIKAEAGYLAADWWILLLGIVTAVGINVYMGQEKIMTWIKGKSSLSIAGVVGFGAFTPLCACGTMAVLLSMFVSSLPWGPVMAFLVSSPLTSPSGFIIQSGILGADIAIVILLSSIIMGFVAGFLALFLEKKTTFFTGQYRNLISKRESCSCSQEDDLNKDSIKGISDYNYYKASESDNIEDQNCCDYSRDFRQEIDNSIRANKENTKSKNKILLKWSKRLRIRELLYNFYELGIKKIVLYFMVFVALGEVVKFLVPAEVILNLFSPGKIYSIPLAALIGLPLYVSGSSSLPLLETLLALGTGKGAVIAFMIAGQGTSIAVIAGISRFVRKKALIFYITFMLISAILTGYIAQWFLG